MVQLSSSSLALPIQIQKPCSCFLLRHSQLLLGTTSLDLNSRGIPRTRTSKPKLSLKCDSFPTFYPADSPPPPSGLQPRFYVGHYIYKGKAALSVGPIAPEYTALDSGSYKLSREGAVLLQFAPAVGLRTYDWSKKQVFSLSVNEIGTLISLDGRGSAEFYHDPQKGRSDEGQIRKVLKVEPLPDGSGYFFNMSVQNKLANVDESIYIPVTKGEYAVLVSAFNFILPHLMGWHAFANHTKPENTGPVNSSKFGGFSEWSR